MYSIYKNKISIITGAYGFIGFHVAKRLAYNGCKVLLVDRVPKSKLDKYFKKLLKNPNVIGYVVSDLNDGKFLKKSKKYDLVGANIFHFAARLGVKYITTNPYNSFKNNLSLTINAIEMANKIGASCFIFPSTSEVYDWGARKILVKNNTPVQVKNAIVFDSLNDSRLSYALSKFTGEILNFTNKMENKIEAVNLRIFNSYGPRMGMRHVIPEIYKRAYLANIKNNKNPDIGVYSVNHKRSFCFIEDTVDQIINSLNHMKEDKVNIFNIGNPSAPIKIGDLAKKILESQNMEGNIIPLINKNDNIRFRTFKISKKLLHNKTFVSLDDGLNKTLDYYKKEIKKFIL
tara:strand:- start:1133 stop:2167 length:1035 start_codon:yes stop_codon:yes gene_type:complete